MGKEMGYITRFLMLFGEENREITAINIVEPKVTKESTLETIV